MSLERTALRVGMVAALSNAMTAPFPTIGDNRIYDSRIDPFQGGEEGDIAPIAIVYTDDDDRESLSGNNGGPPWRQHVNLVIELSMGMTGSLLDPLGNPMKDENGNSFQTFLPIESEPALEAALDLFEAQVERLFRQPPNEWAARLMKAPPQGVIIRLESWSSKRYVEREAQYRFAARQIMIRVLVPQVPDPEIVPPPAEGEELPSPTIPAPLGPLLDDLIEHGGDYAPTIQHLRDTLIDHGGFGPIVAGQLRRVRLKEADAGGGKRPTGVGQANFPET